jgi:hypothetical protein
MSDELFKELLAGALGKSPSELPGAFGEPEKVCDVFVHRVSVDESAGKFYWGVSVVALKGDELEEASTYATFINLKLARKYAKALAEFFKEQGYETHLKGDIE